MRRDISAIQLSESEEKLKFYIESISRIDIRTLESLISPFGYFFSPGPDRKNLKHLPKGKTRACYVNATRIAARNSDYIYCEGLAIPGNLSDLPIGLHHAWIIHKDHPEIAIDTTWDKGLAYFGIPWKIEAVFEIQFETGIFGTMTSFRSTDVERFLKPENFWTPKTINGRTSPSQFAE